MALVQAELNWITVENELKNGQESAVGRAQCGVLRYRYGSDLQWYWVPELLSL